MVFAQESGLTGAAERQLIGPLVMKVSKRLDVRTGLYERDFKAVLRESHGGPTAACSRADNNYIKVLHSGLGLVMLRMVAAWKRREIRQALVLQFVNQADARCVKRVHGHVFDQRVVFEGGVLLGTVALRF